MKKNHLHQPFVLAVISGKGGVGKSMTAVNLASSLNHAGYRAAILDADIGLSNCATLLNEQVTSTVGQWIHGDCSLDHLPHRLPEFTLVTAADDPSQQSIQPDVFMDAMDQVMMKLKEDHDFIIIDTPAGAGEMALWALDSADLGALLIVDEPTAISDVYRLCKYVLNIDPAYRFGSIVNFADSEESADSTFSRFNTILNYFLQQKTDYLGFVPVSESIRESIQKQKTLRQLSGKDPVIVEFDFIAQNVISFANQAVQELLPATNHQRG